MRRACGTALVLGLIAGCSLPLPQGVHESRVSQGAVEDARDIQVLPPEPQPGATPVEIVQGFLGAEGSLQGEHGIARHYLTARAAWVTDQVEVYDPASVQIAESPAGTARGPDEAEVVVRFTRIGSTRADGSYRATAPTTVSESYRVVRATRGEWRIETAPGGLRLTPAERDRSFPGRRVYFLSQTTPVRLVPDRVLLPADAPRASLEVGRLLLGPSAALAGSARTAFPSGTRLVSVTHNGEGSYTVALSASVLRTDATARQDLSAQLLWTLRDLDPGFRQLLITVDGRPFKVPGEQDVQQSGDWADYAPEQLSPGPAFYLAGRQVRLTGPGTLPVLPRNLVADAIAISPDRSRIAVLTSSGSGQPSVLRMTRGTGLPIVLRATGLSSPSWGSGSRGLWLLDGSGRVLLVTAERGPRVVPMPELPGRITALSVSRDGARAALVIAGRLYVGRIESGAGVTHIAEAAPVTSELVGVTQVAWRDGTTLVALGFLSQTFVPVLISVDGAVVRPLPVSGLPAQPQEVAASSLGTIVTSAGRLYVLGPLGFRPGPPGRRPAYPG